MTSMPYPSDLTDREWLILAPLLPPVKPGGRPRTVNLRTIYEWHLVPAPWRLRQAHAVAGLRPVVHRVNGLITNDKLCLSRTQKLRLSWQRMPPSYLQT